MLMKPKNQPNLIGKIAVDALKEIYTVDNNSNLAKKLELANAVTIGNWEKKPLSKTILKNIFKAILEKERNRINGEEFINYGKKKLNKKTDSDLALSLGTVQPTITNWRKFGITVRSIFEILEKSKTVHTEKLVSTVIEFYPVNRTNSKQKKKFEIIDKSSGAANALKDELDKYYGIYIFHDSQGRAVYVGKAKKQRLWQEMNSAFNRKRGDSQIVRKVSHLKINRFDPKNEMRRQITPQKVYLHDIVQYFSAYSVEKAFIDNLEAAIIRMFPNDLLNTKMERLKTSK